MYRPNRIGPWPITDIEIPPWNPSATLKAAIDDVAAPLIGGGVRSVTVPDVTNCEQIWVNGSFTTTAANRVWALGVLISGVNQEPTNNTLYAVSGHMQVAIGTADAQQMLFPIISKLDATPSDPDALITITDYSTLPCIHNNQDSTTRSSASLLTQVVAGNIRGSTSTQSDLPIFVGWAFTCAINGAYAVTAFGSINVMKYTEDMKTNDPWR